MEKNWVQKETLTFTSIDFLSTKVPGQFKREKMTMSVNGGATRMNLDPDLTPYSKINSKGITDLIWEPRPIKLHLKKQNTGQNLHDFMTYWAGFLHMTNKAWFTIEKTDKLDFKI